MNQQICKNCFSTDIESNEAKGEVICLNCGNVLEDNQIVESLEFVENHNGGVSMVGQFIPSSGGKSYIMSMGLRDSREAALQRGYSNIQKIADHLHLPIQIIEASQRLYLIALQRNFTMGRNNSYVAAACLYTICRREKSPVMLIDFSDVLQTPLKLLGQTFLKLIRLLHMNVPNIDPSLFLERFAHKLNLKNDIFKVTYTGIKLIQAMTRDWISTGRRPTGLCGAALLISTRIHGIYIDPVVIADIVRISKPTLIKRLTEFKNTNAAKIKATDFDNISLNDIPCNTLPPCVVYENNRKKRREQQMEKEMEELEDKEENNTVSTTCDDDSIVLQLACNAHPTELKEAHLISIEKAKLFIPHRSTSVSESTRSSTHGNVSDDVSVAISDNFSSKSSEDLNIQVEELCNTDPRADDISNLALKMINVINRDGNIDELKTAKSEMLMNTVYNKNITIPTEEVVHRFENMQNELAMSNNEKETTDLQEDALCTSLFENSEKYIPWNETLTHALLERETVLQNDTYEKFKNLNGDKDIISESSTVANTSGKCHYSETQLAYPSTTDKGVDSETHSEMNTKEQRDGEVENANEIYNKTLKNSFNYELNKTLCEIDEFSLIMPMIKNNKKNETNLESLITKSGANIKQANDSSQQFSDLDFLYENNSVHSLDDINENYETSMDNGSIALHDDTLSNFATDSEIEHMILSEKEKHIKMTIWDDMMKTFMPQYCKQLKKRKKHMEQNVKKKKKIVTQCITDESITTGEIVLKALENTNKHMFNKINCDVLSTMFAS